jgi:hypothetical protein
MKFDFTHVLYASYLWVDEERKPKPALDVGRWTLDVGAYFLGEEGADLLQGYCTMRTQQSSRRDGGTGRRQLDK